MTEYMVKVRLLKSKQGIRLVHFPLTPGVSGGLCKVKRKSCHNCTAPD